MIQFLLGFVGIGGVIGLAFLLIHPVGQKLLAELMKFTVPLLIAAVVMLAGSGFLIWKWSAAADGRKKAEAQVDQLTVSLEQCNANLVIEQGNTKRLDAALKQQNAAVIQLKAEGDERTRRANAAIRKAQEQARVYQRRIARLEAATPVSDDLCVSARSLIIDALKEDRQ